MLVHEHANSPEIWEEPHFPTRVEAWVVRNALPIVSTHHHPKLLVKSSSAIDGVVVSWSPSMVFRVVDRSKICYSSQLSLMDSMETNTWAVNMAKVIFFGKQRQ